ncbi:MAG: LLM class F420-dependent oxidoreductase [Chloroflexi bacterium]|nr:LLM class F420-dependent oxidoreductase [Chloroflexota bacterium]
MRIGLQMPVFSHAETTQLATWIKDVAQTADQGGFASLWVMDHFFQLGSWLGPAEDPMLEGYSTIHYVAALTEQARLGLLVGGVIYRHPAIVIKMVTGLDVLSSGRAYMGIGAAWYEHESQSLGLPFPSMKERFEQLEDILRLAHHMWSGDTSAFEGKQFTLPYPYSNPQPLTQPHPPILIGGMGEKKTLRYVAQYGDACNFFGGTPNDELSRKLDVLKGHCEAVERPYDEIEKTILETLDLEGGQTATDVVIRVQQLGELGFEHVIFNIKHAYDAHTIEMLVKDVLPEVSNL